jgi:hypothetical protein
MARPLPTGALGVGSLLLALALVAQPRPASAHIPDPRFSEGATTPVMIGTASGNPLQMPAPPEGPLGPGFHVELLDISRQPLRGETAILDFSASPGIRLYTEQQAGVTVDCANRRLTGITATDGSFTFFPRFGGFDNNRNVFVEGNGVAIIGVPVRSTDMDAAGGSTGLGDLAQFAPLFLSGATGHPEADFNGSGGAIDMADFSIFAREFLSGAKGTYCP